MSVISLDSRRVSSNVFGPVPGWTATEMCGISGITYRQLDYWTRTGLLTTVRRQDMPGSGHCRFYAQEELDVASRMRVLLDAGLALHVAGQAARATTRNGVNAVQLTEHVCLIIGVCA